VNRGVLTSPAYRVATGSCPGNVDMSTTCACCGCLLPPTSRRHLGLHIWDYKLGAKLEPHHIVFPGPYFLYLVVFFFFPCYQLTPVFATLGGKMRLGPAPVTRSNLSSFCILVTDALLFFCLNT